MSNVLECTEVDFSSIFLEDPQKDFAGFLLDDEKVKTKCTNHPTLPLTENTSQLTIPKNKNQESR
jgi:hypothetical protein